MVCSPSRATWHEHGDTVRPSDWTLGKTIQLQRLRESFSNEKSWVDDIDSCASVVNKIVLETSVLGTQRGWRPQTESRIIEESLLHHALRGECQRRRDTQHDGRGHRGTHCRRANVVEEMSS